VGIADEVRKRQGPPPTADDTAQAVRAYFAMVSSCSGHPWRQVGRCVYCVPCGVRLYQGILPASKR
jgi:hypothetical protein